MHFSLCSSCMRVSLCVCVCVGSIISLFAALRHKKGYLVAMWTSCPLSQQRLCCCCCCCCCPCHGPLSAGPLKHLFMCERDSCPQRWQTVYSISEPVSQSHCQTGDKNTDRDSQPQHASLLAAVLGTCFKQVQILYIYIIYMCVCVCVCA